MDGSARAWLAVRSRPVVVLGCAQHALRLQTDLPVRRRASGGGAMLDGPWLLRMRLRIPRAHPLAGMGPAPLARWLGSVHLRWAASLGIADAALYQGAPEEHWACFGGRCPGEVLAGERKLVGIAQAWNRSFVTVDAATLLKTPPWEWLCAAFGQPQLAAWLASRTTSLQACLAAPVDAQALAPSLRAALDRAPILAPLAPRQVAGTPLA